MQRWFEFCLNSTYGRKLPFRSQTKPHYHKKLMLSFGDVLLFVLESLVLKASWCAVCSTLVRMCLILAKYWISHLVDVSSKSAGLFWLLVLEDQQSSICYPFLPLLCKMAYFLDSLQICPGATRRQTKQPFTLMCLNLSASDPTNNRLRLTTPNTIADDDQRQYRQRQ